MSAAKMVADSTQSDPTGDLYNANKEAPEVRSDKTYTSKVKRKKHVDAKKSKKAKKSGKKGTKKKNESAEADENNPDLDLGHELKEIGELIRHRQAMVDEMFHAVRGTSLQRALPDVLKTLSVEELKQRCVEHLEVMSKKRIHRIMAGDDPATISSSGTEDESSDDNLKNTSNKQTEKTQSQAADSTSQTGGCQSDMDDMIVQEEGNCENEDGARTAAVVGEEIGTRWSVRSTSAVQRSPRTDTRTDLNPAVQEGESEGEIVDSVAGSRGRDYNSEGQGQGYEVGCQGEEIDCPSKDQVKGQGQVVEGQDSDEDLQEGDEYADTSLSEDDMASGEEMAMEPENSQSLIPVLTKNQMELLELEMRAKAIKAMLNKMKK